MDEIDRLIKGLDTHQPNWWQRHASQEDSIEFMERMAIIQRRFSHPPRTAIEAAIIKVKRDVAQRLTVALRAGIEAGLVTYVDPKPVDYSRAFTPTPKD